MTEVVRAGLLLRACLEVLRDADRPLAPADALSDAATLGWITKLGGWALTEAGEADDELAEPAGIPAETI